LGAFVYGKYYPSPALSFVNYASVILATFVFAVVLGKFYMASRATA
jgi:hypothetical protein